MIASHIRRNLAAGGNKMFNSDSGKNNTMLLAAGGLAVLTGLVYWAGYAAEGSRPHSSKITVEKK